MKKGMVLNQGNKKFLVRQLGTKCATWAGAEVLVHCGDIGSVQCVRLLGDRGVPAYAVAGNMDAHAGHLAETAAGAGVTFGARTVEVPLGAGEFLIATHGHDARVMAELLAGQQFRYLCHGHTHQRRDERIASVRIINPGAVRHARPRSVALLDTETDELTFIDL